MGAFRTNIKEYAVKQNGREEQVSVIHVRVGRELADEIRRIARDEKISVRAVVERMLSNGVCSEQPHLQNQVSAGAYRITEHNLSETPDQDGTKKLYWLGELWDGWAHYTIHAKVSPTKLATRLAKVKAIFAYEHLLELMGMTADEYSITDAIADAFSKLWSQQVEQPSSKS